MQTATSAEQQAGAPRRRARTANDLVSTATPILELILKIRSGQITPSNDLREGVEGMLLQLEQRAAALRYDAALVQSVKFALAAFVDETVLTANFPLREEWEKYPLQLEIFGEHLAGVKFFERLDELLKFTENNVEVIEVYYLCLLLGYKGKYKLYMEEQLKGVIANVGEHLRRVGRLSASELSPRWQPTDQFVIPEDPGMPVWMKAGIGVAIGLSVLIYLVLFLLLTTDTRGLLDQIQG